MHGNSADGGVHDLAVDAAEWVMLGLLTTVGGCPSALSMTCTGHKPACSTTCNGPLGTSPAPAAGFG